MHIQFSDLGVEEMLKATSFIILVTLLTSVASAAETTYNDLRKLKDFSDKSIESRGSDLLDGVNADKIRSNANSYREDAIAALESMKEQQPMGEDQSLEKYSEVDTIYFVSMSLGEHSLLRIFEEAGRDRNSNLVVIQGIKDGAKLPAGLQPYYDIVEATDNPPTFVLDPGLFDKFGITKVPAIVRLDKTKPIFDQSGVAKVYGLESANYLNEQIEKGNHGDLGVKGSIAMIEEPNLIEVMKAKLNLVDWEKKKQAAVENYWKEQKYNKLPPASESVTRTLDPSVILTEELTDSDGVTILEKGTVINPLEKIPFNRIIFVFNPTRKAEVDFVMSQLEDLTLQDGRVVLIASEFDESGGWDWYENITNGFNRPLYKLLPDIIKRWDVRYTPTIIRSENKHFRIEEVSVEEVIQ